MEKKERNIKPESEGAGLICTLGTSKSKLRVVVNRGTSAKGKKTATIEDYKGNVNIPSFELCNRETPPIPCNPTTCIHWLNGKDDFTIRDELALLNICIVPCLYGGVIKIDDELV